MTPAERLLGFTLRDWQRDMANDVLQGRDLLAVLPTGSGKSVVFQAPILSPTMPGAALVVTPTVALIQDQAAKASAKGIPSAALHHGSPTANPEAIAHAKLIYTTPETLAAANVQAAISRRRIEYAAIDEAHCVSLWGHQFRPAYLTLAKALARIGELSSRRIPRIAVTATATADIRADITAMLEQRNPVIHADHNELPDRLSLSICKDAAAREEALTNALGRASATIVFCATRRATEQLAASHPPALAYHAAMPAARKDAAFAAFANQESPLIFATSALAMGIDLPHVTQVIHYHPPARPEAYIQEAGRCGRKAGTQGHALLCAIPADEGIQAHMAKSSLIDVPVTSALLTAAVQADAPVDLAAYAHARKFTPQQVNAAMLALVAQELVTLKPRAGDWGTISPTGKAAELDTRSIDARNRANQAAHGQMLRYIDTPKGDCLRASLEGGTVAPCGICAHCQQRYAKVAVKYRTFEDARAALRCRQWRAKEPLSPLTDPPPPPRAVPKVGEAGVRKRIVQRLSYLNAALRESGRPTLMIDTITTLAHALPEDEDALDSLIDETHPDREIVEESAGEILDAIGRAPQATITP